MMNKMLPLLFAFLYLTGCSATESVTAVEEQDASTADRVPYTLFHDFETGELFGWETYPYQQDVGYDALFFTRQSPTYNDSKYAIARPVRANDTVELYQGFSRRLNFWTTEDTRLKTAVFFQSDRRPETLEVTLGTFDGRRYSHVIENPRANEWLELDIPIEEFRLDGRSLSADEHIQSVTLEGTYPIVYYLLTYTILMDNFEINGERQRRFAAGGPGSTDLEEFNTTVLNRHFNYGDTISLEVFPEDGASVEQVRGTLVNSEGNVVEDNIRFDRQGDEWVNDSIYRLREGDARGQWEIHLTGTTAEGAEVRWPIQFLVPGEPVNEHPRLFFSREELDERLANEDSPVARRILENALENTSFMDVDIDAINEGDDRTAEALTGGPYSGWRKNYGDWLNPMSRLGSVIREGSFRYAFTGDEAAAEKAKEALLKLCSFDKWNAAWMLENQFWTYYPVGYTLKPVAYAYDMLHDLLSEEEKEFVREAIMEKGLKLFHRDMVEMNRFPSNNTNHQAVLASGHGLAATAIYGDDPENPWMEPYLAGIMAKAKTFIDRTYYEDGSYGEPYSYQAMATRSMVEILAAFERNFGVNWSTTTDIQHFWKYFLYATDEEGEGHRGFGDGAVHRDYLTHVHGQWFVYRTGNPYIYKYVKPTWENGEGGYMGYLWFRDDIEPISRETLPSSKVFDDAFGMVMRSGWEEESTIIPMRVGPHSNHLHFHQGSFQMRTNGDMLLYDAAYGDAYYENLEFPVYNIQAISKNVMLVDHDPESQKPADYDIGIAALENWPRMTHAFAGEVADAVEADLTSVYKEKLETYDRTLLYTKTGPLFLFDRVESVSPEGHTYSWLFHAEKNDGEPSLSYENNRVRIDRPNARLTIDVLSGAESAELVDTRFEESFISLNSAPGLTEANFFAVLLPEAKTGSTLAEPQTERIEANGWLGARVEHGDAVDFGFFRTSGSGTSSVENFETDADRFTATYSSSGDLREIYFEGSSFADDDVSVESTASVTAALSLGDGSVDRVEVEAGQTAELEISSSRNPSRVLVDGEETSNWSYSSGTLTLEIPEGRSTFTIE